MAKPPMKYKNIAKLNAKLSELQGLTDQHLAAGRYDEALNYALQAHKIVPATVVPLDRAGVICLRAKRYEEAVKYAQKALSRDPNYLNSVNILSTAYSHLDDWDKVREYGRKALNLTEATVSHLPIPTAPEILDKPQGKKVLSFSLFGDDPIYLEGAVLNSELVNSIDSGWCCRFYVDRSVPDDCIERLKANGSEIVIMPEDETMPKTMWRFLAADDVNVQYVAFRDADSVISELEAKLVQEWLESGKRFHTIRDYGAHTELILAGLWGMRAGSVPNMREQIMQFVQAGNLHKRFADQHFLRQVVWLYAKQDLCAHDSVFAWGEGVIEFENPQRKRWHIGCRECSSTFDGSNSEWQDGDWIEWTLYSRYSAARNLDLTPVSIGEEREICRYRQQAHNGKISAMIAQRYASGFDTGDTRIIVEKVAQ